MHLVDEPKSDLRLTYAVSPCSVRLVNSSALVLPAWKMRHEDRPWCDKCMKQWHQDLRKLLL